MSTDKNYYTFWILDTQVGDHSQKQDGGKQIKKFKNIDEFTEIILGQKANLQKFNIQAAVFYEDITTDKWSKENLYGGYFNICCEVKHLAFRCFVFFVLKWLNQDISFRKEINGIVFNCKKYCSYVQIWVNDGFKCDVLQKRYEEVAHAILNDLKVKVKSTEFLPTIEFFPHATYKEDSPTVKQEKEKIAKLPKKLSSNKTFACKVKPFAQCLQEISLDILQIPKTPTFNMKVATIHKISWSERRKRNEEVQAVK